MLAKLLKHEIKTTAGVLGLLSLGALAVGGLGGLMLRYLISSGDGGNEGALTGVIGILLLFVFIALVCYALGSGIFLAYQFYRKKFTDEGYLTFTLPVRPWQIFLSSLLNILLWSLIISIVMIVSMSLIFLIGLINSQFIEDMKLAIREMQEIFQYDFYGSIPKYSIPLQIAASVVEFISQNIVVMTCVTLGAVVARKRKLLGAVGAYFCYSMIYSALSGWLITPSLMGEAGWTLNTYHIIMIVYMLVWAAGGFVLSCWLMKRKLNLP